MEIEKMYWKETNCSVINASDDVKLVDPPLNTVSRLVFSPASVKGDYLVGGGWDSSVRCWEVKDDGYSKSMVVVPVHSPVLDLCWGQVRKTNTVFRVDVQNLTKLMFSYYRMAQKFILEAVTIQ